MVHCSALVKPGKVTRIAHKNNLRIDSMRVLVEPTKYYEQYFMTHSREMNIPCGSPAPIS